MTQYSMPLTQSARTPPNEPPVIATGLYDQTPAPQKSAPLITARLGVQKPNQTIIFPYHCLDLIVGIYPVHSERNQENGVHWQLNWLTEKYSVDDLADNLEDSLRAQGFELYAQERPMCLTRWFVGKYLPLSYRTTNEGIITYFGFFQKKRLDVIKVLNSIPDLSR